MMDYCLLLLDMSWEKFFLYFQKSHQSYKIKEFQLKNFRRILDLMIGGFLAYLSLPVVTNLVSSSQVRHAAQIIIIDKTLTGNL